jgi:methyl-accepting chemotaxis protein
VGKNHKIFCISSLKNSQRYKEFWDDLRAGKNKTAEFKRAKKDGTSIYIQASYTPVRDASGKIYKIIKLAQDITKEKLHDLYFSGQIDAINKSQAVIEFEMDETIIKANQNFLDMFGYELNDIV